MKETIWIGKENGKASDPKNWDNGVPDFRTKAVFDVSERTEVTWDLNSLGIPVEIRGDPEDLIIYISGECMVGGGYFVPDPIRDHFESFRDDSLNLDVLDRPPPGYGMFRAMNDFVWTDWSSGNTNWTDESNWNDGQSGYPDDKNDRAIFNGTWTSICTVNSAVSVGEVDMAFGYTGTVSQSATLTIKNQSQGTGHLKVDAGTFNANGQTVTIEGDLTISATFEGGTGSSIYAWGNYTNTGTFTKGTSTVFLEKTSDQLVTTGGDAFHNLTITNDDSVANITNVTIDITGNLTFVTGTNRSNGSISGTSIGPAQEG